jgi:hypothetical protein
MGFGPPEKRGKSQYAGYIANDRIPLPGSKEGAMAAIMKNDKYPKLNPLD